MEAMDDPVVLPLVETQRELRLTLEDGSIATWKASPRRIEITLHQPAMGTTPLRIGQPRDLRKLIRQVWDFGQQLAALELALSLVMEQVGYHEKEEEEGNAD